MDRFSGSGELFYIDRCTTDNSGMVYVRISELSNVTTYEMIEKNDEIILQNLSAHYLDGQKVDDKKSYHNRIFSDKTAEDLARFGQKPLRPFFDKSYNITLQKYINFVDKNKNIIGRYDFQDSVLLLKAKNIFMIDWIENDTVKASFIDLHNLEVSKTVAGKSFSLDDVYIGMRYGATVGLKVSDSKNYHLDYKKIDDIFDKNAKDYAVSTNNTNTKRLNEIKNVYCKDLTTLPTWLKEITFSQNKTIEFKKLDYNYLDFFYNNSPYRISYAPIRFTLPSKFKMFKCDYSMGRHRYFLFPVYVDNKNKHIGCFFCTIRYGKSGKLYLFKRKGVYLKYFTNDTSKYKFTSIYTKDHLFYFNPDTVPNKNFDDERNSIYYSYHNVNLRSLHGSNNPELPPSTNFINENDPNMSKYQNDAYIDQSESPHEQIIFIYDNRYYNEVNMSPKLEYKINIDDYYNSTTSFTQSYHQTLKNATFTKLTKSRNFTVDTSSVFHVFEYNNEKCLFINPLVKITDNFGRILKDDGYASTPSVYVGDAEINNKVRDILQFYETKTDIVHDPDHLFKWEYDTNKKRYQSKDRTSTDPVDFSDYALYKTDLNYVKSLKVINKYPTKMKAYASYSSFIKYTYLPNPNFYFNFFIGGRYGQEYFFNGAVDPYNVYFRLNTDMRQKNFQQSVSFSAQSDTRAVFPYKTRASELGFQFYRLNGDLIVGHTYQNALFYLERKKNLTMSDTNMKDDISQFVLLFQQDADAVGIENPLHVNLTYDFINSKDKTFNGSRRYCNFYLSQLILPTDMTSHKAKDIEMLFICAENLSDVIKMSILSSDDTRAVTNELRVLGVVAVNRIKYFKERFENKEPIPLMFDTNKSSANHNPGFSYVTFKEFGNDFLKFSIKILDQKGRLIRFNESSKKSPVFFFNFETFNLMYN